MAMSQSILAIYDNGVLTPIKKIKLRKRQVVRVKIITPIPRKTKSLTRHKPVRAEQVKLAREAFGMWADRNEISDTVEWVNTIRASWEERLKELYKDA
jgi:predicted DNA-binding antitoxin AbrB/MazE fold protein